MNKIKTKQEYFNSIEEEIIVHEAINQLEDFLVWKNEMSNNYNIGKNLKKSIKKYGNNIIDKYAHTLSIDLDKNISKKDLINYLKFYKLINNGMILSFFVSWEDYTDLFNLNDVNLINYYVNSLKKYPRNIIKNKWRKEEKYIKNKFKK